jgi:hypothetical protein
MSNIIRVQKDKENPYVMINKIFLNNPEMSLKAKGLLTYLLSLPDDWTIYVKELISHHADGRDSILSAMKELEKFGYIEKEKNRGEKGKFEGYNYVVHEESINGKSLHKTVNGKTVNGQTVNGKPATTNNKRTKELKELKNNNNREEEKKSKDVVVDSYFINNFQKEFKEKYKNTFPTPRLKKLVDDFGVDKIQEKFDIFDKLIEGQTIKNIAGYFSKSVEDDYKLPDSKVVNKKSDRYYRLDDDKPTNSTNYTQREYTDEDFDNMCDNTRYYNKSKEQQITINASNGELENNNYWEVTT